MRNIILLVSALLISASTLHAQNKEIEPVKFVINGDSAVFNPDNYSQNNTILGFQWSGTLKMNNTLKNNANAGA